GGIGLGLRPRGEQPFHRFPHGRFHPRDAVALDQRSEDGGGLGDARRILGGQSDCLTDGQQHCQRITDRPSDRPTVRRFHWRPPIHSTIRCIAARASASATVSTGVPSNCDGTDTTLTSVNGPASRFTDSSPAFEAWRLWTVNATTTMPVTRGLACTAAASAAHAARRPATGPARSPPP